MPGAREDVAPGSSGADFHHPREENPVPQIDFLRFVVEEQSRLIWFAPHCGVGGGMEAIRKALRVKVLSVKHLPKMVRSEPPTSFALKLSVVGTPCRLENPNP